MKNAGALRPIASAAGGSDVFAAGDVPVVRSSHVMGLHFWNPLGLAAGFDRTGGLLVTLAPLGFGHIEVGTVSRGTADHLGLDRVLSKHVRVGVSIGSARTGISRQAIDDYVASLSKVWRQADYIVANLSSPFSARCGDTAGIEVLFERIAARWRSLSHQTGRQVPLLIKVAGGANGTLPVAIGLARDFEFSGAILISESLAQIAAARKRLEGKAVISVGGIASAMDIRDRMSAGASLVQIYTTFLRDGPGVARQILTELERMQ